MEKNALVASDSESAGFEKNGRLDENTPGNQTIRDGEKIAASQDRHPASVAADAVVDACRSHGKKEHA